MFRQGDVLLKAVDFLPGGLIRKDGVLAYGEVTGHKHQFKDDNTIVFTDEEGRQFVQVVDEESELKHEEHENLSIPKGNYEVVIQKEFDPIEDYKNKKRAEDEKRRAERRVYD